MTDVVPLSPSSTAAAGGLSDSTIPIGVTLAVSSSVIVTATVLEISTSNVVLVKLDSPTLNISFPSASLSSLIVTVNVFISFGVPVKTSVVGIGVAVKSPR